MDYYGQQSCTRGAAWIFGQCPFRTGLLKVGMPGATGYSGQGPRLPICSNRWVTPGRIGKNHLGDRNEHLPTMHGR